MLNVTREFNRRDAQCDSERFHVFYKTAAGDYCREDAPRHICTYDAAVLWAETHFALIADSNAHRAVDLFAIEIRQHAKFETGVEVVVSEYTKEGLRNLKRATEIIIREHGLDMSLPDSIVAEIRAKIRVRLTGTTRRNLTVRELLDVWSGE